MSSSSNATKREQGKEAAYRQVSLSDDGGGGDNDEVPAAGSNDQSPNDGLLPQQQDNEVVAADDDVVMISMDDALERLGTGTFQTLLLVTSGLCFAADAMQVVLLSFLTPILQQEWSLNDGEAEFLTSVLFAGAMLGTLVLGPLADVWGRRPVFLLAAWIISIFGFGTAASPNYWCCLCMIFGVGVGVGGLTVPFDVLAEFLPAQQRGTNLLKIEYFWTVGCLYVVAMAYWTLHFMLSQWRWLVVLSTLPCCLALIMGYFCVPETSRWLAAQGRTAQAMDVLRQAAILNNRRHLFPSNMQLLQVEHEKEASIADLFAPKWREITLRLWGAWGAFAFGYYGAIMVTTEVFASSATKTDELILQNETLTADSDSMLPATDFDYGAIFISSSAEFVGTTLVILAVDRVGRIPSQIAAYSLGGISLCALCLLAAQEDVPHFVLLCLGFSSRVFEMAATCVTWVSTAEVLTTEVRSTGHSTANAVARVSAFFCPFIVEGGSKKSLVRVGIVMLIVHLFTVCCVWKLPETKGASMGGEEAPAGQHERLPTDQDEHDPDPREII